MIRSWVRNKISQDLSGLAGAVLMAAFAALAAWRWANTGRLFFALLLLRDVLLAFYLLKRAPAARGGSRRESLLAYFSTAAPLLYLGPSGTIEAWRPLVADLLSIFGFVIATLAAVELGTRIGVSPAARGKVCRQGVYRIFRHPMYTGYIVAEIGWILVRPTNLALFVLSVACYLTRMRAENRVLSSQPNKS